MSTTNDGSGLRKRQRGFAQVPNETIFDTGLSARALGVLVKVIALPVDWDLRMEWLVRQFPEGRDAITTAVRELRKAGLYRVERRRRDDGTFTSGVSVSDTPVGDWIAQHTAACTDQGTDRPKWDISLRVLPDGRVEDEPRRGPVDTPEVDTDSEDPDTPAVNGFPGTGTGNGKPVSGAPVIGEPVTGPPVIKERHTTNTHTQDHVEGVSHVSSGPSEQPPTPAPSIADQLDALGLPPRTCPDHRTRPAQGGCTACGRYRVAREAAEVEQRARVARETAERERRQAREARELAQAELDACTLCDSQGTAVVADAPVDTHVDGKPPTVKCLHNAGANLRTVVIRRETRAKLAERKPDKHGTR